MNQVRLYHPALDTHVSVPESAVDIHRVSGWIPADEYVPPAAEQPKTSQADEEPAGPAEEKAPAAEEKKPTKAGSRRSAEEQ